jgi:hypothetical protein
MVSRVDAKAWKRWMEDELMGLQCTLRITFRTRPDSTPASSILESSNEIIDT